MARCELDCIACGAQAIRSIISKHGGTMEIHEMLLPEFDAEMKKTRTTLERVPEDKTDYKPHDKSMAFGRLAAHVANDRLIRDMNFVRIPSCRPRTDHRLREAELHSDADTRQAGRGDG